jgi:putative membrane protein
MRHMLAAGVLAFAVGFISPAFAVEESVDQKFAADAAKDSMAEVELGQLALKKSDDARVREFANRMIKDHSKANQQLESIAKSRNIVLPSEPGEKLQKAMKKLSGLSGKNFDQAYAEDMLEDHEEAVKLFQDYQREGTNQELREFAKQTLPTLQEHLVMAQKIETALSGD